MALKAEQKGGIALTIALLELSLLPVLLGVAGTSIGGVQLLFYVFLLSSLVSVPISFIYDKEGLKSLLSSKKSIAIVIAAGLFNNAISQLLLTAGTIGTNPSVAGIIFRGWVLMSILLMPFVLKIKVTKAQIAAALVGFAGVYLVVSGGSLLSLNLQQLPYIGLLLGCALSATISALLIKKYTFSMTASVAVFNVSSFAFIGALAFMFKIAIPTALSLQTLSIIAFLGVVTYGIGTTLYFNAYKTLNPIFVGNATLAVPFITILLAALIVGTPIKAYYIGATLLIAGAVIVQQKLSKSTPEHIAHNKKLQIFDITSAFVNNRHFLEQIRADNRALAIKLDTQTIKPHRELLHALKDHYLFTNDNPHRDVNRDELDFINDTLAPKENERVLIGIGNVNSIELFFNKIAESTDVTN